jgi:hemolysin type calcium-binding protein
VLVRAFRLSVAIALLAIGPATLARAAEPLYTEAPRGPIHLVGAPNSLVGEDEGEGFTEGNGSVLIGYDGHKSSEILWNKPEGLFYLGDYHQPRGPGEVEGDHNIFGVIDASHRLLRLYKQRSERYPLAETLRTGAEPVAAAINPVYETVSILNRGSADLWVYTLDERERWHREATASIGGVPTDVVTNFAINRPIFVSNASTDSVTELTRIADGGFEFERTIPVGKDPVDLALGEFVRKRDDEEPEVAVVNRRSDTVTILAGPPGADYSYPFSPIGTYAAGDEPVAAVATNVDGKDGDDLAVVDAGSDLLTLLLNDGHGHFHRAASYPTGREPVAVAEMEFDHSFGPDLVVANHGSHSLTVLLRHEPAVCRGHEARPITGTPGDDLLRGGSGVDSIRALAGDDRVFGYASADCLYGGPGDDFIIGNSTGDLIYGGPGDDRIYGGEPEFNPRRGRDTIIGGPGRDRIHAGAANDVVRAADGERDRVDCGGGKDLAFVDPEDAVDECERVRVVPPTHH